MRGLAPGREPLIRLRYREGTFSHKGRRQERARLYEIPITSPLPPSRKPMRPVAPQSARRESRPFGSRITTHRNIPMLDIVMLAFALGFFVAGIGYAYACERL